MKTKIVPFRIIDGVMQYSVKYKSGIFWKTCEAQKEDSEGFYYGDIALMPIEEAKKLVTELSGVK